MSKVTLSQFSFNRGELSPALHARSDWKYYSSGAEKLLNLVVRPHGGVSKRGGLRLVAPALDEAHPSRFIPFRFSVEQSYMLEFSHNKLRVLRDGGVVVHPEGTERAGDEVVLDTPYPASALPRVRHAQSADVMILTHPDYPPRRLTRRDHHDWRLERLLAGERTATPENLAVTLSGGDDARYVVTAVSLAGGESAPTRAAVADAGADSPSAPGRDMDFSDLYDWLEERDPDRIPEASAFHRKGWNDLMGWLVSCGYRIYGQELLDTGYHWRFYRKGENVLRSLLWTDADYAVLIDECLYAVDRGWGGNLKDALWSAVESVLAEGTGGGGGAERVTTLSWTRVPGADSYRVYRDRVGGGFGPYFLVGETAAATFTDKDLPSQTSRLPEEFDPFTQGGDYPGVCAFFEQRLVLGRSDNKPTSFWGSETGAYNSFIRHTPVEDTDSYEFTLASGEMNEIHWIVPLNEMLLGTSGGEWKAGGGGGAITPSNINARIQSWYGCAELAPVVAGRTVLFAGRAGKTLRSFSYSLEADGYTGRDLTSCAGHLFVRRNIVSMCHQREPSGIVWAVLSDGALLSCAFAPEEDVVAWSRHGTRGRFESCGSVVGADGEDQPYFCVARDVGGVARRFVETMEHAADRADGGAAGLFLDCALTYRGEPAATVSGLEHLEGEEVSVLADGSVFERLPVENGAVALPGGFAARVVHAGLPYAAELVTLEMEPEAGETIRNRARFSVAASVRLLDTRECLYSHSDGRLSEMKFRTAERPGEPTAPFTGEKGIVFSTPPGARTTRLRLVSPSPVPFTVLGIVAEAACGQPA